MNTKYYLKNPKGSNSPIMIYATFDSKRLRMSTKQKVPPNYWDPRKQRVKNSFPGSLEINAWLEKFASEFHRVYVEAKALGKVPTPEYIKEKIILIREPESHKGEGTFDDVFDSYINACRITKGQAIIKSYGTTKNHLLAYVHSRNLTLSFELFDLEFYDNYVDHLSRRKGLTNNTIGKHIKDIKVFLKWAFERDMHNNTAFLKYKVLEEETSSFALNEDELKRFETLDLGNSNRLELVRDLFLIMVYTSLRYSDLKNLNESNIDFKNDLIIIREQKTKGTQIIAIIPILKLILEKYHNGKLPVVSHQEMNRCLKDIGKLAEIDESFEIIRYKGKKRESIIRPKYELLTCHTARRTNITLSLKKGVPTEIVRKQSGHKTHKHFEKYVRMSGKDVVEAMKKAWG